jgi:hypothetical protein
MHHLAAANMIENLGGRESKASSQRQYPARMRYNLPECFICIESETYIWLKAR